MSMLWKIKLNKMQTFSVKRMTLSILSKRKDIKLTHKHIYFFRKISLYLLTYIITKTSIIEFNLILHIVFRSAGLFCRCHLQNCVQFGTRPEIKIDNEAMLKESVPAGIPKLGSDEPDQFLDWSLHTKSSCWKQIEALLLD